MDDIHALNAFLSSLKTEKAKSSYNSLVRDFKEKCNKSCFDITAQDARKYFDMQVKKIEDGKLKLTTVNTRKAMLRSFYQYIITNEYLSGENPIDLVEIPQISAYINPSKVPSIQEIDDILEKAKNDKLVYTAIALIVKCGLPAGVICSLKENCLVQDANNCYGLSFKYRRNIKFIKVPDNVVQIMNIYRKSKATENEYFFCNQKGKQLTLRVLEKRYRQIFTDNQKDSYTLQDIRNASITYMLKNGAPSTMVARDTITDVERVFRYDKVIEEFQLGACDYINIKILS